jgi:hypothetical protein
VREKVWAKVVTNFVIQGLFLWDRNIYYTTFYGYWFLHVWPMWIIWLHNYVLSPILSWYSGDWCWIWQEGPRFDPHNCDRKGTETIWGQNWLSNQINLVVQTKKKKITYSPVINFSLSQKVKWRLLCIIKLILF